MDGGRNRWLSRKALDIVVGIEVGVIGGMAMLALLMLVAPLLGQFWWTYPNLFASHYYSRAVVHYGPGLVTLSGCGLQIFWASIVGAAAAFVSPRGRAAMIFAMIWFLGCYFIIWRTYAPGIASSGSNALLFVSFLLYGSVLRLQPRLRNRLIPPSSSAILPSKANSEGSGTPADVIEPAHLEGELPLKSPGDEHV